MTNQQTATCRVNLIHFTTQHLALFYPERGYTMAADKQRLEPLIRRALRVVLYPTDGPNLHQLVANVDHVFAGIQRNEHHVQQLLSSPTCHKYGLRSRRHNYTLNIKTDYVTIVILLLYKDIY